MAEKIWPAAAAGGKDEQLEETMNESNTLDGGQNEVPHAAGGEAAADSGGLSVLMSAIDVVMNSKMEDDPDPQAEPASPSIAAIQSTEPLQPQLAPPQQQQEPRPDCLPSYRHAYTLYGHTRSISSLSFSPDGTKLLSAGADKLLKIWQVRTGTLLHTLAGHTQGVNCIGWSSDSMYVASGSDDRTVKVWNASSGALLRDIQGHTSFVLCLAYNPQSTLIVSGSVDETIKMWDVKRGRCHRSISAHSEAVSGVDFNRDGTMIVSCSYDGQIRLWDTSSGQCMKTLVHNDSIALSFVTFAPSGIQVLAGSLDNSIRLWDIQNARVLKTYTGHQSTKFCTNATFTRPRGPWKGAEAGQYLKSSTAVRPTSLLNTQVEHITGQLPAVGTDLDGMSGENTEQDRFLAKKREAEARNLQDIHIVSGSEDQRIYIWDLQTKQVLQTLAGHRDVVLSIAVHPWQPIIASASLDHDPSIKLWKDQRRISAHV
ncbi:WD repeat-containing protein 5 [Tilletia horrida]|uniref:WD repeat-containing protein 5 n=1 Tax=Tilletia horrida TaxID=155126 RepID=A0AAN6GWK6_9BASI|nr:WD repeat-containing protein 5 [Tilletia horrida]KAK0556214.1 WD repeat-containing protein 5 [Tilletia horrida]KAK0569123.1 WD repeat-containing protein 5 [Tilletia horrida]